jgi:hypothetical protein
LLLSKSTKTHEVRKGNNSVQSTPPERKQGAMTHLKVKWQQMVMLNKSTNFRSKSFFWCSRCKSVDR